MPATTFIIGTVEVTETIDGSGNRTYDDGLHTPHQIPGWLFDPNNLPLAANPNNKGGFLDWFVKKAKSLWP